MFASIPNGIRQAIQLFFGIIAMWLCFWAFAWCMHFAQKITILPWP